MKSNKTYRLEENHAEKEFHDKFKEMFDHDGNTKKILSAIIFGWKDDSQREPNTYLTQKEEDICLTLVQWFGSPVGQNFLDRCGFEKKFLINH